MSQFDYLQSQISDGFWAGKEILKIAAEAQDAIDGGIDWFLNLPAIKQILADKKFQTLHRLFTEASGLTETARDCALVFLETVHGVNRAFNSKVHKNLAGSGQAELSKLASTEIEKQIYTASVDAYNNSLNLPKLSTTVEGAAASVAATQEGAINQMILLRDQAIKKAEELRDGLLNLLKDKTVKGKERKSARNKLDAVKKSLVAMGKPTPTTPPVVIDHNFFEISSIYDRTITSIHHRPPVLNALVPIAVGGAATVAGAAGVIASIAGWLLGSFLLRAVNIPAMLLPALTNTVTSIVLKVSGSAGANATRFLAGSALRAGKDLLPKIFGVAGMGVSAWTYLLTWTVPIIIASVIIIQAMRNKLLLSEILYVFAELKNVPDKFNLAQAYMEDTNPQEIFEEFQNSAKSLMQESSVAIARIIGVGLSDKREYAVCYDLTKPDDPVEISGTEAIVTAIGPDKIARIASGKFYFD